MAGNLEKAIGEILADHLSVEIAAREAQLSFAHFTNLRAFVEHEISKVEGASLLAPNGGGTHKSSPAICALRLPGPPAEVWLHHLEQKEVYTSVGAACSVRSKKISQALVALGLNEESARQVLRLSFSKETNQDDLTAALLRLQEVALELSTARA